MGVKKSQTQMGLESIMKSSATVIYHFQEGQLFFLGLSKTVGRLCSSKRHHKPTPTFLHSYIQNKQNIHAQDRMKEIELCSS